MNWPFFSSLYLFSFCKEENFRGERERKAYQEADMKFISEMEPCRKKNRKRPRQYKEEEQDVYLVKRVKVVGPSRETNPIHAPRDLPVAIERSKDPKISPCHRRNLHMFYQSLVEHKMKPVIMCELDDDWSFDENMDPDLAEAWRPIMDDPLLPYVIGWQDYLKI